MNDIIMNLIPKSRGFGALGDSKHFTDMQKLSLGRGWEGEKGEARGRGKVEGGNLVIVWNS